MFTPEDTEAIPIALEQIFDSLQMRIMTEIVRMLLEAAEIIPSTGYKMSRLYDLGTSKKRIKDIVARTLNLSDKEVENNQVALRLRSGENPGPMPVSDFIEKAHHEIKEKI